MKRNFQLKTTSNLLALDARLLTILYGNLTQHFQQEGYPALEEPNETERVEWLEVVQTMQLVGILDGQHGAGASLHD